MRGHVDDGDLALVGDIGEGQARTVEHRRAGLAAQGQMRQNLPGLGIGEDRITVVPVHDDQLAGRRVQAGSVGLVTGRDLDQRLAGRPLEDHRLVVGAEGAQGPSAVERDDRMQLMAGDQRVGHRTAVDIERGQSVFA